MQALGIAGREHRRHDLASAIRQENPACCRSAELRAIRDARLHSAGMRRAGDKVAGMHKAVTVGAWYLHGKSVRERARALIEIAHPKFRDSLHEYCEKTKWLRP